MPFEYVYLLESKTGDHRYIGRTNNLKNRVREHNKEKSIHSSKFTPWKLKVAIAFEEETKALKFEKYLKTHSGRSFASRHF